MGRRVLNRKEMRNDYDAAERRKEDEERDDDEELDDEDEDGDDDEEEDDDESDDDGDESDDDGDESDEGDEDAPKKKKKKKAKPKVEKPKAKPRSRAAKVVRMRVVWGVFNNSHQMVSSFEYPKKAEAEAHAAKLMADKKSTHFVQPVKEPIEEKKEK